MVSNHYIYIFYYYIKLNKCNLTFIGKYAFNNYNSLTSITIPKGVTYIWVYAFNNCISLTSITIPRKFKSDMNNIFKGVELSKVKIIYI